MKEWFTTKMARRTRIKITLAGLTQKVGGRVDSVGDDFVVIIGQSNATLVINFAHIVFAEDDY